jgi:Smg protein
MFEILMFLFENYMEESGCAFKIDSSALTLELEKIGFDPYDITRALHWLDGLSQFQTAVAAGPRLTNLALRHYLPEESERLGVEGRGLLLYLEQMGILDPMTREVVIDRVMALDPREVDLGRIKWVILLVLFNQPDKKTALILMQDMVLTDAFDILH